MKESKNIEKLFRESFSDYELDPGKDAWSSVQAKVKIASEATASSSTSSSATNTGVWSAAGSKAFTAIVAIGITGITIGAYFFFNDTAQKNKNERINPENKTEQVEIAPIQELNDNIKNSNQDSKNEEANIKPVNSALENKVEAVSETKKDHVDLETKTAKEESENLTDPQVSSQSESFPKENNLGTSTPVQTEVEMDNIQTEPSSKNSEKPSEKAVVDESPKTVEDNKVEPSANTSINNSQDESKNIPVLPIPPNVFTPNHDNVNDAFVIDANGLDLDHMKVTILNQSGRVVHEWEGFYGFWDGLLPNGNTAPEGLYIYQAVFTKEGKKYPKQGTITLTR